MRGLSSSVASRVSTPLINEAQNLTKFNREIPSDSKFKAKIASNQPISKSTETPSRGKPLQSSRFKNPNLVSISDSHISDNKKQLYIKPIDVQYLSQILARKDWYLLLNHKFKAKRIRLNPQFVASILQNQEIGLQSLKFYIWVLSIEPLFAQNQSVRGVLANALYRKGPVVLSVELLQEIRNSGCRVTEDLLCVLVGSWGRLGLAKYCAEVFGQISFLGLSPTTRLYNAVIDALVKANSLDMAYLKFQQMPVDNCIPDRFTYNILIHGVCRTGVVDEALRLVKQMEGLGYTPNVFTYTILIDGFCNAKRVDEAFQVLETMKKRNVSPSEATIRSLVHGVFRCVAPHKAFELVLIFLERDPVLPKVACDTLLYYLTNNSMEKEAAVFLRKIGERGYFPESSVFNITMTCLIKELDLSETCEILGSFIERGLKLRFNTYLLLIEALYKAGRGVDGNRYLDQMVKDGLVSNVYSYNMVIDCFCRAKMVNMASYAFKEMRHRGIAPNLVTFNTLISGHCKDGDVGKAQEVLEMLLKHGFKPDIFTFSSIIDGLCRGHQIEDAFDCFTEMVEWGVVPNAVIYNILIRSLCVIGDISRSVKLFRKMQADGISPDIFSFNALIQSFCRMNKFERAEKLFISMLTLGLSPDNYTYSAFIKALCKLGRFDKAKEMFLSMESNGCVPDSYTCNLILDALVQQSHFEEARDIIKRCKAAILFIAFARTCTLDQRNKTLHLAIAGSFSLLQIAAFIAGWICFELFTWINGDQRLSSDKAEEYLPQTGTDVVQDDPAQIVSKALICFNDGYIYSSCAEAYRLRENGNLDVPYEYTDQYCSGPCLSETNLVLNCINNILTNYKFYNKATIQDVRDTVKGGCGYGSERGNFNVAQHIEAEKSNAYKAAGNQVLLGLGLMILVRGL